nr:hypothetical protein GCM10020241_33720 [Streptoalloteichus tenebrarius]
MAAFRRFSDGDDARCVTSRTGNFGTLLAKRECGWDKIVLFPKFFWLCGRGELGFGPAPSARFGWEYAVRGSCRIEEGVACCQTQKLA